ncbi:oligopeptidase A [Pseudomaricurvus sp. HS19]|uniref:oligopeptidase A n=1 Tax=Pseudomaricurvus sp. HS19 TaxID=2692626 RepID=UPI00136D86B9|nr:oligopeptidase A [Pseudomaricurvus sp. HS19]MYM63739.1 oligopeptidase A [Pseudomaricurvus sp. HS19]
MSNPLLENPVLPVFSDIEAAHVEPAIDELLQRCRSNLRQVLDGVKQGPVSWETLVAPLEEQDDILNKAWSPVSHLNSVKNSESLRAAYTSTLSRLTAYGTEVGQNSELCEAYKALVASPAYEQLSQPRKAMLQHALRDFHLAGVDLPADKKKQAADLQQRLSELNTRFANNVLDATQGWFRQITDETQLQGLPDTARGLARQAAEQRELDGWVFTLDIPSYLAVVTHADDRSLREELYTAYATRASELGPNAGQWDNGPLMAEILQLRHQLANLLGFDDYAALSLATKMAENRAQVEEFLLDLAQKSRAMAEQDLQELRDFASQRDGVDELQAWDQAYYSEKLKLQKFSISQEQLRPYFPAPKVVAGMFAIVERLFDVQLREASADVWHPDVKYYELQQGGEVIAGFYLDLYARANKRGGAWMDVCRTRRVAADGLQLPIAYLTCNFTPAVGATPALLTHDEVTTLFHEFGHGLHHMLTSIDVAAVSGISGVAWDAVELPSQFLENWCWQEEAIALISGHYQSGEPLPQELLDNLLAAKNCQSALQMLRQIEFAVFDLRLHGTYNPQQPQPVLEVLQQVRDAVAVIHPPAFNRFPNSFTHIFAGGYAAGYYSYKWAEVLSADAFSRFEEEGIFNSQVGADFRQQILERGGSAEAMELFKAFRGREPSVDALLRHSGIAA